MKDSARSPKWFKRGGKGEVPPFPPPEGEAQAEHVRQVKHTGLDTERKACHAPGVGSHPGQLLHFALLFIFYQPLSTAAIRSGQNMHVPHEL